MTIVHGGGHCSWFLPSHDGVLKVFASVPYLNGGLFECLDGEDEADGNRKVYRDGFSRRADRRAFLPNSLFFGDGKNVGLLPLLKRYDFTIDENHATDADIALDPELLGKVFENLLASYNPETGVSARKASGSFYTPREIVDYMVDQSLRAALAPVADAATLDVLFGDDAEAIVQLPAATKATLRERLRALKTIDPACGSGAFPMGLLNRMVGLLADLGEGNAYQSKLHLIEQGIYGVDIQPIAIQISKLRFFISLLCDQTPDPSKPNAGLDQLPNLETHLVIANSLIGFNDGENYIIPKHIEALREELKTLRAKYVQAHTRAEKLKLRAQDRALRTQIQDHFRDMRLSGVDLLSAWNPYDPTVASPFFDPQWMFGLDTFDIVIGNPPYVETRRNEYPNYQWSTDLYLCFMEMSLLRLMKQKDGVFCFITPKFYLSNKECQCVREGLLRNYGLKTLTLCIPFTSAITENVISLVCGRGRSSDISVYDFFGMENSTPELFNVIKAEWAFDNRYKEINIGLTEADIHLLRRIKHNTVILDDVFICRRGVEIGKREVYLNSANTNATAAILIGEDVEAYKIAWDETYMNPRDARLLRFRDFFTSNVIYLRRVAPKLIAAFNPGPTLACTKNLYCLKSKPLHKGWERYVTALLNSKLLFYIYRKESSLKKDKFFPEVQVYMFEHLPLRLDNSYKKSLEGLVIRAEAGEDVQAAIDAVVYRLYGLTEEEVALVERSFAKDEKRAEAAKAEPASDDEDDEEA